MPLLQDTGPVVGSVATQPAAPQRPGANASGLDVLAAGFRQANIVSATYDRLANRGLRPSRPQAGYDPLDEVGGYEDYADRFFDSTSPAETAYIKAQIDAETRDRRTLGEAGGWGIASAIVGGTTDPVTLMAMAVPFGGASRANAVARAVGSQMAFDSASEVLFHNQQETRTLSESALNVGSGAILTGLLGTAVASRIPRAEFEAVRRKMSTELRTPDSTAGAAAVQRTTLEQETIATGGETIAQTIGRVSPEDRLLTSPAVASRRILQELAEVSPQLQKNAEGIRTPDAIETSLKRTMGQWWEGYQARAEAYKAYRQRVKAEGGEVLSRKAFGEEVAYAMRRGDESPIPEAAQAARTTRAKVFEPWKREAIKIGALPEDVVTAGAESYLMRQYNVAKIRRDMTTWLRTLEEGFTAQGVDVTEAKSIAYQVTRNIMGSERGTLDLKVMDDIVPASGRLKERTLKLPDELLEPFLVNDIDNLSMAYLRTLAPEVEITKRFGDRDMKAVLQEITDEYGVLKAQAQETGDNALLKQLADREAADLQDLAAIRDRLYGTFGAPKDPASFFVRGGRFLRAVNYTAKLGGQVISAVTDTARMLMQYGSPKMMASALKLATSVQALKLTAREAKRMGTGLDMVLNTRGVLLGDIGEYSTFAEQAVMRKVSDAFSIATLQSPWNTVMKSWASVMSQDDILRTARKVANGQAVGKQMLRRLASIGIDETYLQRIAEQAAKHGQEVNGLRFARSDQWTDLEAARVLENAVLKEADHVVITPGAGDLPLVYSSEWGKTLLQFKSFGIAATNRLLIPAAQGVAQGDLKAATGIAALLSTGAMSYALKQLAADRPITDDPTKFAAEVVDKSGLLAWGGDVIFPGLWQLGGEELSRFSDRSLFSTIAGPTFGTLGEVYSAQLPAKVLNGEVAEKDVHMLRRMLPGQNIFYLRRGINVLEEETADLIGARP